MKNGFAMENKNLSKKLKMSRKDPDVKEALNESYTVMRSQTQWTNIANKAVNLPKRLSNYDFRVIHVDFKYPDRKFEKNIKFKKEQEKIIVQTSKEVIKIAQIT